MIQEFVKYILRGLFALRIYIMCSYGLCRRAKSRCYSGHHMVICWHGRGSVDGYGIWYANLVNSYDIAIHIHDGEQTCPAW